MDDFIHALTVFLSSMVKFIFGPTAGYALGLHFLATVLLTVGGMMTSVVIFTFFGLEIRRRWMKGKEAKPRSARWQRYGLPGIAFFTPLVLTPIGGTLLAVSSGSPREKIIFYMFISASFWSLLVTSGIYMIGNHIVEWLPEFVR